MRISFFAVMAACLCLQASGVPSDEVQSPSAHHGHSSQTASAEAATPSFAAADCAPKDAATRAEMIALGVIERCADIELLPNAGAFKLATYLLIDAARAQSKTANGITVETAPGQATFAIADREEFKSYAICNLERTIRSEVPRSGRFKPRHGWTYGDARTASYHWDVKARVAQGATAPHLRVLTYFVAIPNENLAQGIERKWCRSTDVLKSLQRD
jgi:hypothetical protein